MPARKYPILRYLLWLLPIPLCWIALGFSGATKNLTNMAMDWRFKVRGSLDAPANLVYVDLDAKAIELMGERPIPRSYYADIVEALFEYGKAKVIGIDLLFSEKAQSELVDPLKVSEDNARFTEVMTRYPNIVLAAAYYKKHPSPDGHGMSNFPYTYRGFIDPKTNPAPDLPSESLTKGQVPIGLVNANKKLSSGSTPRWVPMFAEVGEETYYNMSWEMARLYYGLSQEATRIDEEFIELKDQNGTVLVKAPLHLGQMVEINWFSPFYSDKNPRVSIADVVDHLGKMKTGDSHEQKEAAFFFERFNNAMLLIGPVDPLLQDLATTPFDSQAVPKVGVLGNMLKTLFSGLYIERPSLAIDISITLLLTFIVVGLGLFGEKHGFLLKTGSLLVLMAYIAAVFWLFAEQGLVLPLIVPVGSAITTTFVGVIYRLLSEEKQKGRIKGLFGTYVSPQLVNEMVESGEEPQLGGMEEHITSFFSDVQNFSAFSEFLTPHQLVELMNEYLSVMTDILRDEGGTLDKYIGDAIVAIFGAPVHFEDHALRACVTACRMQMEQERLCNHWASQGDKWPVGIHKMRTRIGLNSGVATVGNMGSKTRFNYTMMGDSVNLAARCEGAAKNYGVYSIITEDAKKGAEAHGKDCVFRYLDRIRVKGRERLTRVYELVGLSDSVNDNTLEAITLYEEALHKYFARDWKGAQKLLAQAMKLEPNQPNVHAGIQTNPSMVLFKRCQYYEHYAPAENWDGVFVLATK